VGAVTDHGRKPAGAERDGIDPCAAPSRTARFWARGSRLFPVGFALVLTISLGLFWNPEVRGGEDDPAVGGGGRFPCVGFVKNLGQCAPEILYYADMPGVRVCVRTRDIVLQFRSPFGEEGNIRAGARRGPDPARRRPGPEVRRVSNVYLRFEGARPLESMSARSPGPPLHLFRGADPAGWAAGVPTYRLLRVEGLYEGIDLVLDARPGAGTPWFLETTDPNADLRRVSLSIDTALQRSRRGDRMVFEGAGWNAAFPCPRLLKHGMPGGVAHVAADGSLEWVPEPADSPKGGEFEGQSLAWGTYLGGSEDDRVQSLAVGERTGTIIVAGVTESDDIPAPSGYDATYEAWYDIYVAAVSRDGSCLEWATYIGGEGDEWPASVEVDSEGGIVVGGHTDSTNLPVPDALDPTFNGWYDIYLAELSPEGDRLLWATYLGGSEEDVCSDLALRESGNILVAGHTYSFDAPVPGGYDSTYNGGWDLYAAEITAGGGGLLWGTYLGGSRNDRTNSLDLDGEGNLFVCAWTDSPDLPAPSGIGGAFSGGDSDLYIARLSSGGTELLWAAYLGGSGRDGYADGAAAADGFGNILVAGRTDSPDLPHSGEPGEPFPRGGSDLYLAKLSPSEDSILWGAYYGGGGGEAGTRLAVDESGNAILGGHTESEDLPVKRAFDMEFNGAWDLFVAKFSASAGACLWGTYLGGGDWDRIGALHRLEGGDVLVGGESYSDDIPVPGGLQQVRRGRYDMYVALLTDPDLPACVLPGDCDLDGEVSIGEVQRAVNMFLGIEPPGCAVDADGDGSVSIGEVQRVINAFLGVYLCPSDTARLDGEEQGSYIYEDRWPTTCPFARE